MDIHNLVGQLRELQTERGTRLERQAAIYQNLRMIYGGNKTCSALRVAPGWCVTAKHGVSTKESNYTGFSADFVYDPETGVKNRISGGYLHAYEDIAIIYAPPSESQNTPVGALQISIDAMKSGEQLWHYVRIPQALSDEPGQTMPFGLITGTLEDGKPLKESPIIPPPISQNLLYAQGMSGYPGGSGGPFMNRDGIVVGVMSSSYSLVVPNSENLDTQNQTPVVIEGSAFVPLNKMFQLIAA